MPHPAPSGPAVAEAPPASRMGPIPPQQARSRAALQRLLASAEHVLVNDGIDEFTIARVAEHAGISVGGVYRRFASKEQLIDAIRHALIERLEDAVAQAFQRAEPSVAGVMDAFTEALGETLAESGRIIPAVLAGARSVDASERGLRTVMNLQQRFFEAVAPYQKEIRHPNPAAALNLVFRSVLAGGAHRAAIEPWLPDGLTWQQWAREIADMTTAYLTAER
ncbi:MAG: TetR/AcrR family transcriptional regulator [Mycobacterium sp.]